MCGVYATAGVECTDAEILLRGSGIGDHLVFVLDFCTLSMLGDNCPRVVPAPGRTLRCDVHAYKTTYNKTLEQLINRHKMYKKLANIVKIPDTAVEEYDHRMNKWDDELRDFMIAAENKCRSFKSSSLEWSPTVKVWLSRRWILARLQKSIARKKPVRMCRYQNLHRDCRKQGIKGPGRITQDELNMDVKVCKQKLKQFNFQFSRHQQSNLSVLPRCLISC